jgi:hypothetical protein
MRSSECIEACSEVIADVKSSREDPLSSQATTFIETTLLMYVIVDISICGYQLMSCINQVRRERNNDCVIQSRCFRAARIPAFADVRTS